MSIRFANFMLISNHFARKRAPLCPLIKCYVFSYIGAVLKLYRFRPLSNFLFKELNYQELYCAMSSELNDPQDLSARVNFYADTESELCGLAQFIMLQSIICDSSMSHVMEYLDVVSDNRLKNYIEMIYKNSDEKFIGLDKFIHIMADFYQLGGIPNVSVNLLISRVKKVISSVLNNSSISCFTESVGNYLMWSHYASAHRGICIEFDCDKNDNETAILPIVYRNEKTGALYEFAADIHKVKYNDALPSISFSELLYVFSNLDDVDVKYLSKARCHVFAQELVEYFTNKTASWSSENEWRHINVSFNNLYQEDRILRYDIKSVSGIYFGAKTSVNDKLRIKNIFERQHYEPSYYKSVVNGSSGISFENESFD